MIALHTVLVEDTMSTKNRHPLQSLHTAPQVKRVNRMGVPHLSHPQREAHNTPSLTNSVDPLQKPLLERSVPSLKAMTFQLLLICCLSL